MTRRAVFVSLILGLLQVQPGFALELCKATSADLEAYPQILASEIHRRSTGKVLFTYIVTPSFSNEYGFALTKVESGYNLSSVRFTESVWYGSVEEREPGRFDYVFSPEKVKAKTKQVLLDSSVAEGIIALLNAAIVSTKRNQKPDDGRYGFDGVSYRIAANSGDCVETWSPDPKTSDETVVDALDDLHFSARIPTEFLRTIWQKRLIRRWKESAPP